MLIGILSIFSACSLDLSFRNFLLVTAKITYLPGLYLYWPTNAFILTTIVFSVSLSPYLHLHQC